MIGQPPKYSENLSASIVALISTCKFHYNNPQLTLKTKEEDQDKVQFNMNSTYQMQIRVNWKQVSGKGRYK